MEFIQYDPSNGALYFNRDLMQLQGALDVGAYTAGEDLYSVSYSLSGTIVDRIWEGDVGATGSIFYGEEDIVEQFYSIASMQAVEE